MSSSSKIMLVGGGTGGHFYPLMSVAMAIRQLDATPELLYIGPDPYDLSLLERENIRFVWCPAGKWRRYASFENIIDIVKACVGIFIALVKLFIIYPDVILSKGGYTSLPVVIAAWFLRIPIIVHESDAVPGRANRLAARFARTIAISYEVIRTQFPAERTVLTGIPMRPELLRPPRDTARSELGLTSDLPLILILGGSLGAMRINELILDSLDELLPRYEVLHQTGTAHHETVALAADELVNDAELIARYHPVPFLDPVLLNDALHTAAIVISRAGSGTIHEIAAHGKPAILIPISGAVSHDQHSNAFTYARATGATVMEEANMKDGLLVPEIDRIMQDPATYADLVAGSKAFSIETAADDLARITLKLAAEH